MKRKKITPKKQIIFQTILFIHSIPHPLAEIILPLFKHVLQRMNSSLESLLNESQGEQHTLLLRCKETIEELQLQLSHTQRSLEIVQQQRDALRSILDERDKRVEDLQIRAINLTLSNKKQDHQFSSENERLGKTIKELQDSVKQLKEENRKVDKLNEMLINDKKLLSDIIHQKDDELSELRNLKFEYENRIEQYKASLEQIQNLHQRQVSNLRVLIQHSREGSEIEYHPTTAPILYSSNKPNRQNFPYKSAIRKNTHLRLTSQNSTNSRESKRLDLNRQASQSLRKYNIAHSNSSRYKSNINIQQQVNDLYGIVHNARTRVFQ